MTVSHVLCAFVQQCERWFVYLISYLFLLHLEWTLHLCCFWFHNLCSHDGKQMAKSGSKSIIAAQALANVLPLSLTVVCFVVNICVDLPRYCICWRRPPECLTPSAYSWELPQHCITGGRVQLSSFSSSPLLLSVNRVKSREGKNCWEIWKYSSCNKFFNPTIALWSKNDKIERRVFRALHVADSLREIFCKLLISLYLFFKRKMAVIVTLFKLICVYL